MKDDDNIYKTRETLLCKIRDKHDDDAWEDFVFYYKSFIYIICRRMNLGHSDSEDVVQKVLIAAWEQLPEFKYDSKLSFRGWLSRVTRHKIHDLYRHQESQRRKIENSSAGPEHSPITEHEIEAIAEKEWKNYVASMAMENIKDRFSENVLEIFRRLSDGESRDRVAEQVGLPPNTISVYKKRVTAQLCKEIKRLRYELGGI